jgi:hypothetical protein
MAPQSQVFFTFFFPHLQAGLTAPTSLPQVSSLTFTRKPSSSYGVPARHMRDDRRSPAPGAGLRAPGASPARLPQPVLCRSGVLSSVPCNARLPWTPLRYQSRTGVPCVSRLCELICASRAFQPLPHCVGPSPCRSFPLHTTPSLAHPRLR